MAGLGDRFADVGSVDDLCDVLSGAGSPCNQGAIELMSLALNLCHQEVCADTPIGSQVGPNTSVGASYNQADDLLSSGGDCVLAQRLSSEINTGRAIEVNSVRFAKLKSGRARIPRIQWAPMGGGSTQIVKYDVWRRQAGSLAPFLKIGETTSLIFEDSTPGSFEYEVTPVR